jgi:hypothetical protein
LQQGQKMDIPMAVSDTFTNDLRIAIRAKIASGGLPAESPKTVVTHAGESLPCDACDLTLGTHERECEVRLRSDAALRLHLACFVVWQDEVAKGLLAALRSKVQKGTLPLPGAPPKQVWAGKGTGRRCDGCDQTITPSHVEYEVDVAGGRPLVVHPHCLELWHQLRMEQGEISGGSDARWPLMAEIAAARELQAACREARLAASRTREHSRAVRAITARLRGQVAT